MTDVDANLLSAKQWAALSRMKRAHERGTGCRLTAEMIDALYVSFLGELWGRSEAVRAKLEVANAD